MALNYGAYKPKNSMKDVQPTLTQMLRPPVPRTLELRPPVVSPAASTASGRLRSAQQPGAEGPDATPRTPDERTRIRADIRMRLRLGEKNNKRASAAISTDIGGVGVGVAPYTPEESARIRAEVIDRNEEYSRRFFRSMNVEREITESRGGMKDHYDQMIARHKKEEKNTRRLLLDEDSASGDDDILSQYPFPRDAYRRESLTQRAVCPDPAPKNSPSLSTLGSDSEAPEGGDLSVLVKGGSDGAVPVELARTTANIPADLPDLVAHGYDSDSGPAIPDSLHHAETSRGCDVEVSMGVRSEVLDRAEEEDVGDRAKVMEAAVDPVVASAPAPVEADVSRVVVSSNNPANFVCHALFHTSIQEVGQYTFKPVNTKGEVIKSTKSKGRPKKGFVSVDLGPKTVEFKLMWVLAKKMLLAFQSGGWDVGFAKEKKRYDKERSVLEFIVKSRRHGAISAIRSHYKDKLEIVEEKGGGTPCTSWTRGRWSNTSITSGRGRKIW